MAHDHHHSAVSNLRLAFFLNLGFTLIEFIGGLRTNSTAILADAVHDLGDSFALAQAWYFESIADKDATQTYTYGYRRFSLLGAVISAFLLLISSFYVLGEAIPKIAAELQGARVDSAGAGWGIAPGNERGVLTGSQTGIGIGSKLWKEWN